MKIGWIGNAMFQPSGYGRVAHYVLPYLQKYSKHEIVHFANTGLQFNQPFELEGVKLYGRSGGNKSGKFGVFDVPYVGDKEDVDVWVVNFDLWTVAQQWGQIDVDYVLYPPVDHSPLPPSWKGVIQQAHETVPYCYWGKQVIEEGIDDMFLDNIKEPIYHGVDTETYHPIDITKKQAFARDIDESQFVAGIIKNNQGTRPKYDKQLKAFKQFADQVDDDPILYIHASEDGNNAFNLRQLAQQVGVAENVIAVNQDDYRYGITEERLNERYNAMDVLMNVTASEGFGLTLAEAFAAETPVIAGGFSAMPEVVSGKIDEVTDKVREEQRGWLVPIGQKEMTPGKLSERADYRVDDITEALLGAYEAFRTNQLGGKGINARRWAEKYKWPKVNEQWVEYLNGLETRLQESPEPGEQKQAYLVVGPESSGTRLMTEILTELGCEGDPGHNQRWDANLPTDEEKIVWRRSIPHDGKWPKVQDLTEQLREQGYAVTAIVTTRDMKATYNSQINAPYLANNNPQTAFNNVRKAYPHIFQSMGDTEYIISSFDNLVSRPDKHIGWLKETLGLEGTVDIDIKDANAKYYD